MCAWIQNLSVRYFMINHVFRFASKPLHWSTRDWFNFRLCHTMFLDICVSSSKSEHKAPTSCAHGAKNLGSCYSVYLSSAAWWPWTAMLSDWERKKEISTARRSIGSGWKLHCDTIYQLFLIIHNMSLNYILRNSFFALGINGTFIIQVR